MTADELKRLARLESDRRLKMRYLAIYHFFLGTSRTQIAKYLGVAGGSVNSWVTSFLTSGLDGLKIKPSSGRPLELTPEQVKILREFIQNNAVKTTGGRLVGEDIKQFIREQFCVHYSLSNLNRLLHSIGFSWITCRSKHPKQSEQAQAVFKNLPNGNDLSHPL